MSSDNNMATQHSCACSELLADCLDRNRELQAFINKRELGMEQDLARFRTEYRESFIQFHAKEKEELKAIAAREKATAAREMADLKKQIEDLKKEQEKKSAQSNEELRQFELESNLAQSMSATGTDDQTNDVCAKLRRDLWMAQITEKDLNKALRDNAIATRAERRGFEEQLRRAQGNQKTELGENPVQSNEAYQQIELESNLAQSMLSTEQTNDVCANLRRDLWMAKIREKELTQSLKDEVNARKAARRGFEEPLRQAQEDPKIKDEEILASQKAKDEGQVQPEVIEVKDRGLVQPKVVEIMGQGRVECTQPETLNTRLTYLMELAQEARWKVIKRSLEQEIRQKDLQLGAQDVQLQTLTEVNESIMQNITQMTEDETRLKQDIHQFVKEPTTVEGAIPQEGAFRHKPEIADSPRVATSAVGANVRRLFGCFRGIWRRK